MSFKYAIALTGSIATGKSTVSNIFKKNGFDIIDADKTAHKILDREAKHIAKIFGEEYIQGNRVNRKKLGELIFNDKDKKQQLEHFIHPLIYKEIFNISQELDRKSKPYIVDIPLFFETERYKIDKVIVVYSPKDIQLKRLMERDNISKDKAVTKINSQIDIDKKIELGTYIIDNSKDLNHLQKETFNLIKKIAIEFKN